MPVHMPRLFSRRRLLMLAAAAGATPFAARWGRIPDTAEAAAIPVTLAPDASDQFRAVANSVAQMMPKLGIPGAALGILTDGKAESGFFGVRDVLSQQPVTADTLFQAGSVTKTYTATAIMHLVERGMIDLDAPVRTYLPDLMLADKNTAARVTTKNLLTHTGDWWGDSVTDTGNDDDDAIARFVAEKLPTFPQLAPLGSLFSYNNTGFVLMGRMLETLTGQPYRATVQSLVLDPISLGASVFTPDDVIARPHALAHRTDKTGTHLVPSLFLPRNLDPAGGLFTTLADFLAYARFHLGDGTADGAPVLERATLNRMQTPTDVSASIVQDLHIGLPWFITNTSRGMLLDHPGDTFGQHAEVVLLPDRQFAMVLLTNANTGASLPAVALAEAGRQYLGVSTGGMNTGSATGSGMAGAMAVKTVQLPPEKLGEYVGEYRVPSHVLTVRRAGQMDGQLILDADPGEASDQVAIVDTRDQMLSQVPLAFLKEDVGIAGNMLVIEFLRHPDGSVGYMRIAERLFPRQYAQSVASPVGGAVVHFGVSHTVDGERNGQCG